MTPDMSLSELSPLTPWVQACALCLGCIIGSFLNVVVWRVPRGESLLHPPSHCPNCGHAIRPWENIPVVSWLLLRGRCSGCHQPISIRYPLGELATGLVYLAVFQAAMARGLPVAVIPGHFFLLGTLISVAQIDLRHRLVPDVVTLTGMAVALLLALLLPDSHLRDGASLITSAALRLLAGQGAGALPSPLLASGLDSLLGLAAGLLLLGPLATAGTVLAVRLRRPDLTVMGWGDVKCLMMLGAFLGPDACLYILCAASCLGFAFGLLRLAVSRGRHGWSVPFAPFLSLAALAWLLVGKCW